MPKTRYEQPAWLTRWEDKCADDGQLIIDKLPPKQQPKMQMISIANQILDEYEEKGFQLTLRQLYYQFVARDLIGNTDKNYKKLGAAVSDGRMWGFIDWTRLVDRGRNFIERTHWEDPARIISATAHSFAVDRWRDSDVRFEVWVEKQALEDIVAQAAQPFDVGYIACKGYMSQSEMWAAAQRLIPYQKRQHVVILHLGDHDPSGVDMSRDIQERLRTFRCRAEVRRIALTMDQVEEYNPPPNPAKVTDSRADEYIANYGYESWELDALQPEVLTRLIQDEIKPHAAEDQYEAREREEGEGQHLLRQCSNNWPHVKDYLGSIGEDGDNYYGDEDDYDDE